MHWNGHWVFMQMAPAIYLADLQYPVDDIIM